MHSFRPKPVQRQPDLIKEITQEWMLRGPSRLMLEAFEANETEKRLRQEKLVKKSNNSNDESQETNGKTFNSFANGYLNSSTEHQ